MARVKAANISNATTRKRLVFLSALLGKSDFELIDEGVELLYSKHATEIKDEIEKLSSGSK